MKCPNPGFELGTCTTSWEHCPTGLMAIFPLRVETGCCVRVPRRQGSAVVAARGYKRKAPCAQGGRQHMCSLVVALVRRRALTVKLFGRPQTCVASPYCIPLLLPICADAIPAAPEGNPKLQQRASARSIPGPDSIVSSASSESESAVYVAGWSWLSPECP